MPALKRTNSLFNREDKLIGQGPKTKTEKKTSTVRSTLNTFTNWMSETGSQAKSVWNTHRPKAKTAAKVIAGVVGLAGILLLGRHRSLQAKNNTLEMKMKKEGISEEYRKLIIENSDMNVACV